MTLTILAIEFLCAAQGIDFLQPLKPGKGSGLAYERIRNVVPHLDEDRNTSRDIATVKTLIHKKNFLE